MDEAARKEYWASLALRHCRGLGARYAARLARHFGSAYAAVQARELWHEARFPHGLPNKEVIEYSIASLFLSCFVQGMPTAQLENGSALKFRPLTRK